MLCVMLMWMFCCCCFGCEVWVLVWRGCDEVWWVCGCGGMFLCEGCCWMCCLSGWRMRCLGWC